MSKVKVGLVLFILCVSVLSVTAQAKEEKEDAKGFLLTAGGGLSLNLPAIDIVFDGYINHNIDVAKTDTFVAFGFGVLGGATFTYQLKNQWALGGAVQLGYNFMGGPHANFTAQYKNARYNNTYIGLGKILHSFIADINFCARTPSKKGGDLIMEAGVRMMPTWTYLVYKEDGVLKVGDNAFSKNTFDIAGYDDYYRCPGYEGTMMAGPNLFIGIDYFITKYFDLIGGLRFSALFGCANTKYIANGIFDQGYLNSIIQIAFEFKFNYYHIF